MTVSYDKLWKLLIDKKMNNPKSLHLLLKKVGVMSQWTF